MSLRHTRILRAVNFLGDYRSQVTNPMDIWTMIADVLSVYYHRFKRLPSPQYHRKRA